MLRMTNAATAQAVEISKERLREFLESSDTGRQAMAMSGSGGRNKTDYDMDTLNKEGKRVNGSRDEDLDDI